jgi:hypothetical protein
MESCRLKSRPSRTRWAGSTLHSTSDAVSRRVSGRLHEPAFSPSIGRPTGEESVLGGTGLIPTDCAVSPPAWLPRDLTLTSAGLFPISGGSPCTRDQGHLHINGD